MTANSETCLRCKELEELLKQALARIDFLEKRVKEIEDKLNTNSSNSSKPQSQDPFRAPRKKKPTGRKQSAQKGHKGHARQLVPIEEVQALHDLKPNTCLRLPIPIAVNQLIGG